ncbi:MAG TPA: hypothetical protein VHD32_05285 [Candidatus Didemnitutus sp.]|nr:hypothetical protein [Candidatus Didemnitutus sp.]
MMPAGPPREKIWLGLGLAITAFKLWLTRGQMVFAIGPSDHDDLLFLQLAKHLASGEWLGPYNQLTLAKGPMYPLWIAAAFWAGVPLFLSQQFLYAGACAALARACRPAVSAGWRLLLYCALLWNPMSFDASSMGRVLRQHIYGPLALLVFAALVALRLRREQPLRRQAPWAVLLGLAAAALYLTREEVLWIIPSVVILSATWFHGSWRSPGIIRTTVFKSLLIAMACALVPIGFVSWENFRHYRWFGTVEFRASEFADAYGALSRIRVGDPIARVPITREARLAAYGASPAFAELRPFLEGNIGHDWAAVSSPVTGIPADKMEIGGGWFMWALRDAVAASGHADNARHALKFYRQIADQLNAAADARRIPAGPAHSGFAPTLRPGELTNSLRTAVEFGGFMISFQNFNAVAPASFGSDEQLQLFRDLTREKISPPAGQLRATGPEETASDDWKIRLLQAIGSAVQWPLMLGIVAGIIAAGFRMLRGPWEGTWTFALTVGVASAAAVGATLVMYGVIEATSFPVLTISSFAPVYPLAILFSAAAIADAWVSRTKENPESILVSTSPTPEPVPVAESWLIRRGTWLLGLVALLPFLIWWRRFAELFWFGDDYFLLDQMAAMGFWPWTAKPFTETFAPLFKIFWGGSALMFDGSYLAMLALMWATHAVNTVLLGRVLSRASFPAAAVFLVQLAFALSAANIETLGWSVQWSSLLATTFLLGGMLIAQTRPIDADGWRWRWDGLMMLMVAASACSFARGVVTGPVLALAWWLRHPSGGIRRSIPSILACLAPAVVVAGVIVLFAAGNQQHMSGHWTDAFRFGGAYFLFNPAFLLFGADPWNAGVLITAGLLKVGVVVAGLILARGKTRNGLILFLAYDLANAILMGIGRHHTGLPSVLSSRYCYSALLATLPFVGVVFARGLEFLRAQSRLQVVVTATVLAAIAVLGLAGWPRALDEFTIHRGNSLRALMAAPTTKPGEHVVVPSLEFMHVERAKALIRAYHLH